MKSKDSANTKREQNQTEREKSKQTGRGEELAMTAATTVQKWGNSLAVRIPKDVAEKVRIDQGTEMEWQVSEKEGIKLVKKQPPKVFSLEELLAQCTPDRAHDEIDFGIEGNELI
jgi:antitoxin MazE